MVVGAVDQGSGSRLEVLQCLQGSRPEDAVCRAGRWPAAVSADWISFTGVDWLPDRPDAGGVRGLFRLELPLSSPDTG